LSTAAAKLWRLFNFHLLFYYDMAEAPSSTFNPRARHLLQLQSSSPTSSLFNFNPPCQLSSLVAANFNPRHPSNSKPRRYAISSILLDGRHGVLDAATAR
jgi:hypothetical protein